MPQATGSATLGLGMVQIPVKLVKASTSDAPNTTNVCGECGAGDLGYIEDDDGNRVECKECGQRHSWWNGFDGTGFELGDDLITLDADAVKEARSEPAVDDTGNIKAAPDVEDVLAFYAVQGNYYLVPQEDFEDQYGVLVRVLQDEHKALLTHLHLNRNTRRYAIISRGGVLLALELADKQPLDERIEWEVDEAMEAQAKTMFEGLNDDPELPDVEGEPLKALIREHLEADGEDEEAVEEAVAEAV